MPTLRATDKALDSLTADAIIIGIGKGKTRPLLTAGAQAVDTLLGGQLPEALKVLSASGAEGEVTRIATLGAGPYAVVAAVGLGTPEDGGTYSPESIRRAAGSAVRALKGRRTVLNALAFGADSAADGAERIRAAGEGALLGAYRYLTYKSETPPPRTAPAQHVDLLVPDSKDGAVKAELRRIVALAKAICFTRDLVNAPPNDLFPAEFARRAEETGKAAGLKIEILNEKALAKGQYGGVLAVGSGSDRKPRLVRMHYMPAGPAVCKIALVGKGITFDSGGISIKPAAKMDEMKADMAGAAAMVATACLVAELGLPVELIATIPMAENLPSGTAYRPADVITFRNGKTAEITNTDAEGRVVLADAIARACEDEPDWLIETSTLTGAASVALGNRTAGVMGSDNLRARVIAASERTGEAMWAMPLPPELRKGLDSSVADLINANMNRLGGMLVGGHFLSEFVTDGTEWAHIDIAGPAFNSGSAWGYNPKGGTGVPIRTLLTLIEDLIADSPVSD
ncbi:MAG: leucyl aminopeptidase [Geodermatophilaceae bacterium]|nr:leucyl aminopeptidase [Geodermatophilaceae bacterium]